MRSFSLVAIAIGGLTVAPKSSFAEEPSLRVRRLEDYPARIKEMAPYLNQWPRPAGKRGYDGHFPKGTEVRVLERHGTHLKVESFNRVVGYVKASMVSERTSPLALVWIIAGCTMLAVVLVYLFGKMLKESPDKPAVWTRRYSIGMGVVLLIGGTWLVCYLADKSLASDHPDLKGENVTKLAFQSGSYVLGVLHVVCAAGMLLAAPLLYLASPNGRDLCDYGGRLIAVVACVVLLVSFWGFSWSGRRVLKAVAPAVPVAGGEAR